MGLVVILLLLLRAFCWHQLGKDAIFFGWVWGLDDRDANVGTAAELLLIATSYGFGSIVTFSPIISRRVDPLEDTTITGQMIGQLKKNFEHSIAGTVWQIILSSRTVRQRKKVLVQTLLSHLNIRFNDRTQAEFEVPFVMSRQLHSSSKDLALCVVANQDAIGVEATRLIGPWGRGVPGVTAQSALPIILDKLSRKPSAEQFHVVVILRVVEAESPHGGTRWRIHQTPMAPNQWKPEDTADEDGTFGRRQWSHAVSCRFNPRDLEWWSPSSSTSRNGDCVMQPWRGFRRLVVQ